jgi:hypothetical protein
MSELMKGHVSTAAGIGGSMENMIPGNDNHPSSPGFARSHLIAFHNNVPHGSAYRWDRIRIGIDQNRLQARIVIVLEVQQEKAGISGNGDLDFIGHLQTATALEVLFGDEDVDVAPQILLLRRREPAVIWDIALEDLQP